jgi:hypothetical protein
MIQKMTILIMLIVLYNMDLAFGHVTNLKDYIYLSEIKKQTNKSSHEDIGDFRMIYVLAIQCVTLMLCMICG